MPKCAFEKFADIGKVLQPLPSAKMAWRSYLIAKQCYSLFVFTSNSLVLQDIDWTLLDPHILVLLTSYLPSLCWHWPPVAAVGWPHAV